MLGGYLVPIDALNSSKVGNSKVPVFGQKSAKSGAALQDTTLSVFTAKSTDTKTKKKLPEGSHFLLF